jgi:GNAT superfamily N-acetyltransferase
MDLFRFQRRNDGKQMLALVRDQGDQAIRIRFALPDDAPAVALLVRQLGYDVESRLIRDKLDQFGESARDAVIVAEADGSLLGEISLHVMKLFHQQGRLGRITSLVVDRSRRGTGIGRQLIEAADAYFVTRGCVRAEVASADHREMAHVFYDSNGYAPEGRRFVKPLRPAIEL